MLKKFFLLSLALILICQAALAKDKPEEIPPEDRIKIFVEVTDVTNFVELETDLRLQAMLTANLAAQNIFDVINTDEKVFEPMTLGDKKSMADVGELIVFNPPADDTFDAENYRDLGVDYVVRCKVLGIGVAQVIETYGYDRPSIGIGIDIGRHRNSRFGIGVGTGIDVGGTRKLTYYSVVAQVQFVSVDTNTTLWRQSVVGQIKLNKKPSKGYDDANDEAYLKTLREVTKNISKRVTDYSQKFLVGKNSSQQKIAENNSDD